MSTKPLSTHLLAALALSSIATLGLVGCGDEEALPPEFVSFELSAGTVEAGGLVSATVEIMHFSFAGDHDEEGSTAEIPKSGHDLEGHVHVYLDTLDENPIAMVGMHMFDIEIPGETAAGSHTLIARLHGHDHKIIEPQVIMETTLEVTEASTQ